MSDSISKIVSDISCMAYTLTAEYYNMKETRDKFADALLDYTDEIAEKLRLLFSEISEIRQHLETDTLTLGKSGSLGVCIHRLSLLDKLK